MYICMYIREFHFCLLPGDGDGDGEEGDAGEGSDGGEEGEGGEGGEEGGGVSGGSGGSSTKYIMSYSCSGVLTSLSLQTYKEVTETQNRPKKQATEQSHGLSSAYSCA